MIGRRLPLDIDRYTVLTTAHTAQSSGHGKALSLGHIADQMASSIISKSVSCIGVAPPIHHTNRDHRLNPDTNPEKSKRPPKGGRFVISE